MSSSRWLAQLNAMLIHLLTSITAGWLHTKCGAADGGGCQSSRTCSSSDQRTAEHGKALRYDGCRITNEEAWARYEEGYLMDRLARFVTFLGVAIVLGWVLREWSDWPKWIVILVALMVGGIVGQLSRPWWDWLGLKLGLRPYDDKEDGSSN